MRGLWRCGLGLTAACCLAAGCQPANPLARAGVDLAPPGVWKPVARHTWAVPGTPLAAWSGPEGTSLVVYRGLPAPDLTADALAFDLATRMTNLPGVMVIDRRALDVSGHPAARVELTGLGTGDALAPSGTGTPVDPSGRELFPTRRIVVVVPRRADTLALVWHAPASSHLPDLLVGDVLAKLRLADPPASRAGY